MRRRGLPLALIFVASLLAFLAIFAVWANRQLLNTDNWTDTSTQLLEDDAIRGQLSAFLVDQLYTNVDVKATIEEALPPRADPLAGPAAGALRQPAEQAVDKLLQRPRPQQLWEQLNRRAHRRFIQVLEGGGDVVSTQNGVLVLDLKSLLTATQERVGIGGRAAAALPADAAQLTIVKSDQLGFAQDLLQLLKTLAIVLVVLTLGLFALAIGLARGWRREALRACGFGLIAAAALALVGRSLAGGAVVDALATTDGVRPAAEASWTIGTSLLVEAATAMLAYGVVIVLAAWLAGPTRVAVSVRGALAPWLREPGYAYGGLAVIVLVLIAWGPVPSTRMFLPMVFLIAVLAYGVEVLRRQAAREHPDASREETLRRFRAWLSGLTHREPDAGDRVEQLERLGRLRDGGVISQAEFDLEKQRLLGGATLSTG
ncbi:MAG TPA: SHOCT domain-containing protein [Thermoleophilaceae bacterium]|nr:SHOCT domain-containing protein [Thermoleophilaceae bacterium]